MRDLDTLTNRTAPPGGEALVSFADADQLEKMLVLAPGGAETESQIDFTHGLTLARDSVKDAIGDWELNHTVYQDRVGAYVERLHAAYFGAEPLERLNGASDVAQMLSAQMRLVTYEEIEVNNIQAILDVHVEAGESLGKAMCFTAVDLLDMERPLRI